MKNPLLEELKYLCKYHLVWFCQSQNPGCSNTIWLSPQCNAW